MNMVLSLDQRTFRQEVLESATPVLVDFWAPWCGLCRIIHPMIEEFRSDWAEPVKLVRVNADDNLKLANTYRIKSLPTILLFDGGQVVHRLEGFNGREDLRRALSNIMVTSSSSSSSSLPKSA